MAEGTITNYLFCLGNTHLINIFCISQQAAIRWQVGLHVILHAIVMRISSVKPVLWLVLNLHHLFSKPVDGAAVNTQSRRSLTSYAIHARDHRWLAFDNERDIA